MGSEDEAFDTINSNAFSRDPGVDEKTWTWLTANADGPFSLLLQQKPIFTKFEFDRKVPLMFALNIMCTSLAGYYNRNDRVRKFLDEKSDEFEEKEVILAELNIVAEYISKMNLLDDVMWWNKANFFTLVCELYGQTAKTAAATLAGRLLAFQHAVPQDYALAAREAVWTQRVSC